MIKKQGVEIDLVSIGMPVYNAASCIRESLESLLGQSYKNFELIISDNASTDNTEKICRSYAKKDKRIRYIRQKENIGAVNNFNFVLKEAQGKYFMWAADDDLWDRNYIKCIMCEYKKTSQKENVGLIATRWIFTNLNGNLKIVKKKDKRNCRIIYLSLNQFLRDPHLNVTCLYGIYRKNILVKIGGLDRSLCPISDLLMITIFLCHSRIKIIENELFTKRMNPSRITTMLKYEKKNVETFLEISKRLINIAPCFFRNLCSPNIVYFLQKTKLYYSYNSMFIETYYNKQKNSLKLINLISTFKVFMFLLSYNLQDLRETGSV